MNLNLNQGLAIGIAVMGVFVASAAQLTDLFGPLAAKYIIAGSGLSMSLLSVILGVLTGATGQAKAAVSQPGVQLVVDRNATPALAALALDHTQPNIVPAEGATEALRAKLAG